MRTVRIWRRRRRRSYIGWNGHSGRRLGLGMRRRLQAVNGRTQSSGSGFEAGHVHVIGGEDVVRLFLQDGDKRGRVLLLQGVEQILLDGKPVLHVVDQEIHILGAASWVQQARGIIGEFGELPGVI
jgi:hypothetical protein